MATIIPTALPINALSKLDGVALNRRLGELAIKISVSESKFLEAVARINPAAAIPFSTLPEEVRSSVDGLKPESKRFHGAKVSLAWFPPSLVSSPCNDKFGYMSTGAVRTASKLPFNLVTQALMGQLGALMADPARSNPDSTIPAGYTYFGQFVDHDVTLDVSSSLDVVTDATTVNNMRTPALDLDSMYGRGPALDPHLYAFPSAGVPTAIKMQLGTNRNLGTGGPGGTAGFAGMVAQASFDVPRVGNPQNLPGAGNTALLGDPRNDENLIISQFHQTMLRFHNKVVDMLLFAAFQGDVFVEAKKIVTQHYQWAVVNDYLKRICGAAAVTNALSSVTAAIGSPFSMPVEFSVAAYRFGHSMIRDQYWVNFNQINASLGQVFAFSRNPNLPVVSNWVVDFNAFFTTGVSVPINNKARSIDSVMSTGLGSLPGFTGAMAALATRNLRRALALELPSGQGMAGAFGITSMTSAQLMQGLPANEIAILNSNSGVLLQKTPLWYYILREANVLGGGNSLGPVGAKIVADTFVRMLKRDANSYLNVSGFTPLLPQTAPAQPGAPVLDFTVADLVIFAGVTQP